MDLMAAIKNRVPDINIVVTGHCTEGQVRAAPEAGADGYVLKDNTRDDLLKAPRGTRTCKVFLSPGICGRL
jgi:DNA-binding NarL/FixJ family response regulator